MGGIFKAYDIRGTYPSEVNPDVAYTIARAFAAFTKASDVIVGGDARTSTEELKESFIKGLMDSGCHVLDMGLCSTDMGYFASWKTQAPAGVLVTASHNPWNYNGFKMFRKNAEPIGELSGMPEIERLVQKNSFPPKKKGSRERINLLPDFIEFVLGFIDERKLKKLTIIFDTQHGAGGVIAPELFKRLPCTVIPVHWDVGERYASTAPNPLLPEARAEITTLARKKKADVAIAIDGDCDRCFFLDEHGEFIAGDFVTGLLARAMVEKYPKHPILYDVRSSWYVKDTVSDLGGKSMKCRVGHAFIKHSMKENDAKFAGELSGHYYYNKDSMYFDSAWVTAIIILELLSEQGAISKLLEDSKKYHMSGEINSEVRDKDAILKKLERQYHDGSIDHLDGISVEYPLWKFNVRPSNTEPLLRLNVEGKTQKIMEQKRDEVLRIIRD